MLLYIYIYICAVKLKAGPISALFKVKNWSKFFFFENRVLPAERRPFQKEQKQQEPHFSKLKAGQSLLRNMLGPILNFDLDQFLTLKICHFYVFVVWLKPLLYSIFSKNAKFKDTQKSKKLFVNSPVLTALLKMYGFSAFFILGVLRKFQFFERCF